MIDNLRAGALAVFQPLSDIDPAEQAESKHPSLGSRISTLNYDAGGRGLCESFVDNNELKQLAGMKNSLLVSCHPCGYGAGSDKLQAEFQPLGKINPAKIRRKADVPAQALVSVFWTGMLERGVYAHPSSTATNGWNIWQRWSTAEAADWKQRTYLLWD